MNITYEYPCILRYRSHMKTDIKNIHKKHHGSIIILKKW